MPFDGNGNYIRSYRWVNDDNSGIAMQAARFDIEDDGFAAALSNCITRDGQAPISQNISWNGKRITNLGDAVASTDAMNQRSCDARYGGGGGASPGCRLSLATGTPVMSANVNGAAQLYLTPYINNTIPLWDGTKFASVTYTELTNLLSGAGTAGPAAAVASSVYDLFAWNNAGTPTLTRGPAWTNDTTRSAALSRVNGVLVNASAISGGPGAGYGTYVGTIGTDASGATVTFNTGTAAVGGGAATIGLWNMHNRVNVAGSVRDTTSTWAYAATTWRAANNSPTARVTFVTGLAEDPFFAAYNAFVSAGSTTAFAGIGIDTTTTPSGIWRYYNSNAQSSLDANATMIALGRHYMSAIENNGSTTTETWYGNFGPGLNQTGLYWFGRY